jgi:hypothetical protein
MSSFDVKTIVQNILSGQGPQLVQNGIVGAIEDSIKKTVEAEVSKFVQQYLDANPHDRRRCSRVHSEESEVSPGHA